MRDEPRVLCRWYQVWSVMGPVYGVHLPSSASADRTRDLHIARLTEGSAFGPRLHGLDGCFLVC